MMGNVVTAHAKHIFDWESLRAGQYFSVSSNGPARQSMSLVTIFPLGSVTDATNALQPFIDTVKSLGANITAQPVVSFPINDLITYPDDFVGGNLVVGSRLIPASTYWNAPESVGNAYVQLLKTGGNAYVLMFLWPSRL
jgi:hypothetical protein